MLLLDHAIPIMDSFPNNQSYIDALRCGYHHAMGDYHAARLVAMWDGAPLPKPENFPRPPAPTLTDLLQDEEFSRALRTVAEKKRAFFSRRKTN